MVEVITQAIYLIDQAIELVSHKPMVATKYPHLTVIRDDFKKLLEKDLFSDDFARLFCRRLERLVNYETFSVEMECDLWIDVHEDLLYVLYGPDVKQDSPRWELFMAAIELEGKLEQRELQFVMNFGERKHLHELLCLHQKVLDEYLQKCISFHSKVQVRNLIDNVDDLLSCTYEQTEVLLTTAGRLRLQEKLKCIEISFDCSNISFTRSIPVSSLCGNSYKKERAKIGGSLPTGKRRYNGEFFIKNTSNIPTLLYTRWIVIEGDSGSAKTTTLRWMTRVHAEAFLCGDNKSFFRIPILIRIEEFAEWLKEHPDLTLMDYIGKHTWFSQPYNSDDIGSVLKEFIYHGHALILLDGLNKIPTLEEKRKIVELVSNFIDNYVRSPDFLSPFDEAPPPSTPLNGSFRCDQRDFESMMTSRKRIGNQIIITSRFVGYDLYRLDSSCIERWPLEGMEWEEVLEFGKQWVKQVERRIRNILLDEAINLGEVREEILINRLNNIMNAIHISDETLMNPHMISLFCMHIFTSSHEPVFKSPMEVYHYPIQSILRTWSSLEPNIKQTILIEFLTALAAYVYSKSANFLIDEFDMKNLCSLVLKQLNVSTNRRELQEYTNKIISLFNSPISILVEESLEIFSFIHTSFQRYFLVQALIKKSPNETIVKRFFKFMNKRRFFESLLMALGWISWNWSFDNYNHFCDLLISYPTEHLLPLGTLLLFDALKYIHNLPSKEVMFKAFNNLVDHPSTLLSQKYLTSSQLPIELIVEWMQLNITNEKRLFQFCRCLLYMELVGHWRCEENSLEKASPRLFQQLWSLRSMSQMAELVIDQTLHRIIQSSGAPDHIFENTLYLYLLQQNNCSFNIHPLIFSVILALYGGLNYKHNGYIVKIHFSPKSMHRESLMIQPIIEYLVNIEQSHSIKLETLIKRYENIIQEFSPEAVSSEIIDAFIALICLRGVSKPSIYKKFVEYKALSLVLLRFKQILLYLNDRYYSCHIIHSISGMSSGDCLFVSEIESITNEFFRQPHQSNEQLIRFSFACISAWKKLGLSCLSDFLNLNIIQTSNINQDLEVQLEYRHYITSQQQNDNNNAVQITEYKPLDLLVFVPQSLQQLFYRLVISPINKDESLPLIVLLSECLIHLDDIPSYEINPYRAVSLLYPLCKEHKLENYSSILFWADQDFFSQGHRKQFSEQVKNRELLDRFPTDVSKNWEILIDQERERIREAMLDEKERDLHLFGACLSLARLFQVRHRNLKGPNLQNGISIFTSENEEIYSTIENICDPILQLVLLNIILRLNKPSIFTDEQINRLNRKIIILFNNLFSSGSLLLLTYLFVQYYQRLQSFPKYCRQFIKIIGEKFLENTVDKQNQESAYIALRMLNDIHLSCYLSEFEKQTTNLSDILHFNSTTFFHYFTNNSSFDLSDIPFLSSMYLIELSTDVQILEMYTNKNSINIILPLVELDQLWEDPLKHQKTMTKEVANWITKYLKESDREYIDGIIERVSSCCVVEETAYEIIPTWCEYRKDKDLNFFAYYAALFLTEDNSSGPILHEMFNTHNYLHLKTIIKNRLELKSVTSSLISNILTPLIKGAYLISMDTSACIHSTEILDLLLKMEQKRILVFVHTPSTVLNRSYLSTVRCCSENVQNYLIQHLQDFKSTIKEQYITMIIKWIILESIDDNNREDMSMEVYEFIMKLLQDQQMPLVQMTIANGINAILMSNKVNKEHVFIRNDLKKQLEDILNKTSIDMQDLLAACLLAYGNCLLEFNHFGMYQSVSIEIQNLLERISVTSFSEIVSARALLCLLFSKIGNVDFQITDSWINDELNLPAQNKYYVLLQLTLYKHSCLRLDPEELVNHIEKNSSKLLDQFLIDLYNDLCKGSEDISSVYETNYVPLGLRLLDIFSFSFEKKDFDEQKFKTALCRATKKGDPIKNLGLYASFGEITHEFVEILINVGEKHETDPEVFQTYSRKIKKVSGRDVIEKLFELFRLKFRLKSKFSIRILEILVYLAQQDIISPIDVHDQVSFVTNNGLYEYDKKIFSDNDDPFFCLMRLRNFNLTMREREKENKLLTMKNIEDSFKEKIQLADKNSGFYF